MPKISKNRKHISPDFSGRTCFLVLFLRKVGFELFSFKSRGLTLLLQRFLNGNSHGNGSADHGVVAHAQEAHHFHVKSACRRLCACGARLFLAESPTFRKSGDTSIVSIECAFLTAHILSHLLFTKQAFLTKMNIFFSALLSLNISPSSHIQKHRK